MIHVETHTAYRREKGNLLNFFNSPWTSSPVLHHLLTCIGPLSCCSQHTPGYDKNQWCISYLFIFLFYLFQKRCSCSWISEQPQNTSCFFKNTNRSGRNTVTIFTLCILISHHQGLVHVVLVPRAAIIILRVHSEAEEEDVHHVLKDRQEAVSHQEREHTHDEQRQDPNRVVPLVVQSQDAAERRA